jgi:hypothetical protein
MQVIIYIYIYIWNISIIKSVITIIGWLHYYYNIYKLWRGIVKKKKKKKKKKLFIIKVQTH